MWVEVKEKIIYAYEREEEKEIVNVFEVRI